LGPALAFAFTVVAGLGTTGLAGVGVAAARSERTVVHPIARVWPTAVRFLRVDEGLDIVDKDPDAGYVVFELKDKGRTFRGYLELVTVTDDAGKQGVRLMMTIAGRPEYTEAGLLDRMLDKLRAEYGDDEPEAPSDKDKGRDGDDKPGDDKPAPKKPPAKPPAAD
jgi:hypothetical protein